MSSAISIDIPVGSRREDPIRVPAEIRSVIRMVLATPGVTPDDVLTLGRLVSDQAIGADGYAAIELQRLGTTLRDLAPVFDRGGH